MLLINHIKEFCKVKYQNISNRFNEIEIEVHRENLIKMILFLKDDHTCFFDQLTDITAVDYPHRPERFLLIYQLLSVVNNNRIRIFLY